MKKNYFLDIVLFLTGLICIVTGIILDFHWFSGGREVKMLFTNIHIYTGYTMSIGLLFHLAWHMGWIRNVTKLVFRNPSVSKGK